MQIAASLFMGFAIVMVVLQTRRARHRGPRVLWFPPSMRPGVNRFYRGRGWREPYDDSGSRRSWWRVSNSR